MEKNYAAYGQCGSCNRFVEHVGSTPDDAKLLLRHHHGYRHHIFQGPLDVRTVDLEEARRIEKRKDT